MAAYKWCLLDGVRFIEVPLYKGNISTWIINTVFSSYLLGKKRRELSAVSAWRLGRLGPCGYLSSPYRWHSSKSHVTVSSRSGLKGAGASERCLQLHLPALPNGQGQEWHVGSEVPEPSWSSSTQTAPAVTQLCHLHARKGWGDREISTWLLFREFMRTASGKEETGLKKKKQPNPQKHRSVNHSLKWHSGGREELQDRRKAADPRPYQMQAARVEEGMDHKRWEETAQLSSCPSVILSV